MLLALGDGQACSRLPTLLGAMGGELLPPPEPQPRAHSSHSTGAPSPQGSRGGGAMGGTVPGPVL